MENLIRSMSEVEEQQTLDEVRKQLAEGREPLDLVEALRTAMSMIGERFEKKEYYLSELIMAAEIFNQATALITPQLKRGSGEKKGCVIIGTVQGDIHYIGKNIVASLLSCEGYDVCDLGEDVAPATFVERVKETGARVVGLSALLTVAFESMKKTVDALREAGLREEVKVLVGGAPVDQRVVDYCGADAYGRDASEAVRLVGSYLNQKGEGEQ